MNFLEYQHKKVHSVVIICPEEHKSHSLMSYLQIKTDIKWISGIDLSTENTRWDRYKDNTMYIINLFDKTIVYGTVSDSWTTKNKMKSPYCHVVHVDMFINDPAFKKIF